MRDPERIYPMCMRLAALWSEYPDLRLGQIIDLAKSRSATGDLFYLEDDELLDLIEFVLEH